ncbi:MAG TPA: hypothetical protein VJH03_21850 [Blastocatellia bacterium]|nr:hypothetical protein [Blastocatellia bacterium]
MKLEGLLSFTGVLVLSSSLGFAAVPGQEFTDPGGKYKIALVGDWRAVSYSDAIGRQKTEFVYKDRSEGLLKITKESLAGASLDAFVRQEEESLKIYRPGYERGSIEAFGGGPLRGLRFAFYSTDGGRKFASTHYYLQDGDSVWALRFNGKRGTVDLIRNITDQMARSLRPL